MSLLSHTNQSTQPPHPHPRTLGLNGQLLDVVDLLDVADAGVDVIQVQQLLEEGQVDAEVCIWGNVQEMSRHRQVPYTHESTSPRFSSLWRKARLMQRPAAVGWEVECLCGWGGVG